MIQIKFPDPLPPEIEAWKVRARAITELIIAEEDLAEKHKLIDRYENHWRKPELIDWMSDLFFEKCWYTETKFGGDYQELEHFRPKKGTKNKDGTNLVGHPGYYWLAFNLDNYRLSKRRPNAKKGTFFPIVDERYRACCIDDEWQAELPLFLDPMDEEDCLLISFNDDGKPCPSSGIENQDVDRVNFTIEKLFLDERVLNIRRAQVWNTARGLYYKYQADMKEAKARATDRVVLRAQAKKDLVMLKNMLKPSSEFSAVAKLALIKTNEITAISIATSAA
ncbi:MAG: hypothetical protein V7749_17405 [Cocleimonas sp.]